MRSHELIICPPDLLVKSEVWSTAKAAALRVLVEDTGEKERIITDMCAQQKGLFRRRAGECDQHIGNILAPLIFGRVWRLQTVHAGKSFEKRGHVLTKLPVADSDVSQDVARKDVKIKMGRDRKVTSIGEDCFDQPWGIENGIARFCVAEQFDE